jgi:hypothetical protein
VEHGGALFGYGTEILRFPEQHFSVVCLCNLSSVDENGVSKKVADIYLEKILLAESAALQPPNDRDFPDPGPFAGKYLDARKHFVYSFAASDGNLVAWGAKLRRVGPNQFRDLGTGTITFDRSKGVMKATLKMDGEAFFAGERIDELHLNDAALQIYTGRYKSTEIDATYNFSITGGNLVLRYNLGPALKLTPIAKDEFESDDFGTIVFHRDARHRISGLSVFSVNARNVSFDKTN